MHVCANSHVFFAFCARWEIDHKKIKYKEKIAKGNFGEVWLGSWLGSPVAIKTVIGSMAQDSEFIERFVLEIKLMSNLHHPNIVMFLGACLTPVASMCLLLEFCVHGNLHEFMKNDKKVEHKQHIRITQETFDQAVKENVELEIAR